MLCALTVQEADYLRTIVQELSRPEARDPKTAAVKYFLTEHRTDGRTWIEHGCIVFSQYYDAVRSLAGELAVALTLINVDLPWNPSRLEQRLGRIKRFGQVRDTVDMLNLV